MEKIIDLSSSSYLIKKLKLEATLVWPKSIKDRGIYSIVTNSYIRVGYQDKENTRLKFVDLDFGPFLGKGAVICNKYIVNSIFYTDDGIRLELHELSN